MTVQEVLQHDSEFQYKLLSRLQQDCEYFLGNGAGHVKHLWADTVEEHIEYMKAIWNNLKEKPEWLSFEKIERYEKGMSYGN
jgi:hypothetical protein